jgi:hypothetical protein
LNLAAYNGQAIRLQFWHWHEFSVCNKSSALCTIPCALDSSTYSGGLVEIWNGTQWVKVSPSGGYTGDKIDCHSIDAEAGQTCQPCDLDGVKGFPGSSNGTWALVDIDISLYAINGFQVRFHFASYADEIVCHTPKRGWFIDDVKVVKLGC